MVELRKWTPAQVDAVRVGCARLGVRFNPADYRLVARGALIVEGQLGGALVGYFRETPMVSVDPGGRMHVLGIPRRGCRFTDKGRRLTAYLPSTNLTLAAAAIAAQRAAQH